MRRFIYTAVAVALGVALSAAPQQNGKPTQASGAKGTQKPGIAWTATLDAAVKAMGADSRPVILYFTFDT